MLRFFIFIAILIAFDIYAYQAFRFLVKGRWGTILYFVITLLIIGGMIYQFSSGGRRNMSETTQFFIVAFVIMMVCKIVIVATMLSEDVYRLVKGAVSGLSSSTEGAAIPSRRRFMSQLALGLAAIPFASILYGVLKGRYNFKVLKHTLTFDDLPAAFDGYKITQISDVHSGSFDNVEKIDYAIDLINEQDSDVILFTGDMVNNEASEMEPYKESFARLKARDGKFSVLGNHDYGDYVAWPTAAAKMANLDRLKEIQKEMDFTLLLNEHQFIERDGQRLAIVGVENWGAGGFKKAGDLNKAIAGLDSKEFRILMSHDPSHWEFEVKEHPDHFHLTLSGHTHGMQFGIEIPGWFKWSPVKYRYQYWAGIYEDAKQFINVNRGFGYLAFPGRVGIWPEITVIELRQSTDST